jgi:hypothetical protein
MAIQMAILVQRYQVSPWFYLMVYTLPHVDIVTLAGCFGLSLETGVSVDTSPNHREQIRRLHRHWMPYFLCNVEEYSHGLFE